MSARRVLILQHVEVEKPGIILDLLDGSGAETEVRNLLAEDAQGGVTAGDLPAVDELAGLVVMGGPMNADDTDTYPALKLERDLLGEAAGAGVPVLGVCLGAQLLARARGLEIVTGEQSGRPPEIGWHPLQDVDREDPVVGPLAGAPAVLHWHGDRIVPGSPSAAGAGPGAGVRPLARTETTECQAFRAGPAAWGLQFHLEVTPELLDAWLEEPSFVTEAEQALGADATDRLRAGARSAAPVLRPAAARALLHFCSLVQGRAAER